MIRHSVMVKSMVKTDNRPIRTTKSSKGIVSKNSHRIWCIVKVQSIVRRWLAMKRFKQMLLDHREKKEKDKELNNNFNNLNSNNENSDNIEKLSSSLTTSSISSSSPLQQSTDNQLQTIYEDETVNNNAKLDNLSELDENIIVGDDTTSDESDEKVDPEEEEVEVEEQKPQIQQDDSKEIIKIFVENSIGTSPLSSRSSSISSCVSSSSQSSSPLVGEATNQPSSSTLSGSGISNHLNSSSQHHQSIAGSTSTSTSSLLSESTQSTSSPRSTTSPRKRIVNELIKVEKGYVSDMRCFIDVFLAPIKQDNMLTEDNLYMLFCNIEEIYSIHLKLLASFERCQSNWTEESTIGNLFLPFMGEFQKLYEMYINNYEKAFALYKYIQTSTTYFALHKMILGWERDHRCRSLDFGSFLVMPVQRMPRYTLLLKEIEKHTAQDHPDYNYTALSLCQFHDLTLYLNESKRTSTNTDKIQEVIGNVHGTEQFIHEANSKFIKEGQLSLLKGIVASTKKDLYVYLFKECLICTEITSHNRQTKTLPNHSTNGNNHHHSTLQHHQSSMSLSTSLSSSTHSNQNKKTLFKCILFKDVKAISILKNFKDSFQVVTSKKVYTFVAISTDQRDKWLSAMSDCMNERTPPPSPSPRAYRRSIQITSSSSNLLSSSTSSPKVTTAGDSSPSPSSNNFLSPNVIRKKNRESLQFTSSPIM